jgi:hypothetical protein
VRRVAAAITNFTQERMAGVYCRVLPTYCHVGIRYCRQCRQSTEELIFDLRNEESVSPQLSCHRRVFLCVVQHRFCVSLWNSDFTQRSCGYVRSSRTQQKGLQAWDSHRRGEPRECFATKPLVRLLLTPPSPWLRSALWPRPPPIDVVLPPLDAKSTTFSPPRPLIDVRSPTPEKSEVVVCPVAPVVRPRFIL